MINGKEAIQIVRDYFEKARKMMPEVTDDMLCDNGDGEKIYYMNGNDSTRFDWDCNDRLCEFFMFYKSTEMGFIKVFVNKDDTINGYMYKEEYKYGDEPIRLKRERIGEGNALYLTILMDKIADQKQLWDKPIGELDFETELKWYDFADFEESEDEDVEFEDDDFEDDEEIWD